MEYKGRPKNELSPDVAIGDIDDVNDRLN